MNFTLLLGLALAQNHFLDNEVIVPLPQFEKNDNLFLIGGVMPLTNFPDSGYNLDGIQQAEALRYGIKVLNNDVRVLPNITLAENIRDAGGNVNQAIAAALSLQNDGIPAVIGPSDSAPVSTIANLYNIQKIPLLSYGASAVDLSSAFNFPTFFRTTGSDLQEARAIVEVFVSLGWDFVAPLFSDDEIGSSGSTAFPNAASRRRVRLTCSNTIKAGTTSGMESFSNCLAESFANVVVLYMKAEDAINAINIINQNPINRRVVFIAPKGWGRIADQNNLGNFPILHGSFAFVPSTGDLTGFNTWWKTRNPTNSNYSAFLDYWQDRFKCILNGNFPNCPDSEKFRTFPCKCTGRESHTDNEPLTLNVNYVFDALTGIASSIDSITQQEKCSKLDLEFTPLCEQSTFTTLDLGNVLASSRYDGLTGAIEFENNDRRSTSFDYYQIQEDLTTKFIGRYNSTGLFSANAVLSFKNGTTPESRIIPSTISLNETVPRIVTAFSVIAIICVVSAMIYVYIHRKSRVVIKTSLFYLESIFFGILLVYLHLIIWSLQPSRVTCNLKLYIGAIGIALIFGSLFSKIYRVFLVQTNRTKDSMISIRIQIFFLIFFLLIEVGLLTLMAFISGPPFGFSPQVIQSQTSSLFQFTECNTADVNAQDKILIAVFFLNGILLVLGLFVAQITRNIRTVNDETKFILVALADYFVVGGIFIPVYFTISDALNTDNTKYLVRSLVVLFTTSFTFGVIALPKILSIRTSVSSIESGRSQSSGSGGRSTQLSTTDGQLIQPSSAMQSTQLLSSDAGIRSSLYFDSTMSSTE